MSKNDTEAEMPKALRLARKLSEIGAPLWTGSVGDPMTNGSVPVDKAVLREVVGELRRLHALSAAAPAVAPGITYLPAPALQGLAHQGCSTSVAAPSASQPVARIVAPFPGMDEPWPEEQKKRLAELCGEIFGWPQQGETAGAVYAELPRPGSPEASAMIDSVLAEYNYPSNTKNAARAGFEAARRMLAAAPHAAAASGATATSENDVEEALRERDELDEYIDALLDEVLGADRPEWSSAYGRAEALQDVQERITALHAPSIDRSWDRFQSELASGAPVAAAPMSAEPGGQVSVDAESFREIIRDIGQHIEQGVLSERKAAEERPGYGTGLCVHIHNQMAKMARMLREAPASPTTVQAATTGEFIDGVNIKRLAEALVFLGCAADGQEAMAANLSTHINNMTRAVLRSQEILRTAASGGEAQAEGSVFPMAGNERESDLGEWQDGGSKPTLDGPYLREFDEGTGISEFYCGKWLRDGFFPSDIQDARWRGRRAAKSQKGAA